MGHISQTEKLKELETQCREHGLPNTIQRQAVMNALTSHKDHPTADQIYEDIRTSMPHLSRATVYRTLETFVELGVAQRAGHTGNSARFDANTDQHHHLVCTLCDKVIDIDDSQLDQLPKPRKKMGFLIKDFSVYYRGICPDCQN